MEAVSTCEGLVTFRQTTRCNIPEDNSLHTRGRENLTSLLYLCLFLSIYSCVEVMQVHWTSRTRSRAFPRTADVSWFGVHWPHYTQICPGRRNGLGTKSASLSSPLALWITVAQWSRDELADWLLLPPWQETQLHPVSTCWSGLQVHWQRPHLAMWLSY
jgi:hypothetical protein